MLANFCWKSGKLCKHKEEEGGGAGMMHNITKPRHWRGGAQVTGDVFEDAQRLKRVEVKKARVEGTLAGGYARTSDRR